MKILYGIQGTGNGHLVRASVLAPELSKYANVDLLVSGSESDLSLIEENVQRHHGLGFHLGEKGGIDYRKTLLQFKPLQYLNSILTVKVKDYDLIISDFEPITAWAAKLAGVPSIAVSHQAAFRSQLTPRPQHKSPIAESILKHYTPTTKYLGFHFDKYGEHIDYPIIRQSIRELNPQEHNHHLVYLPAYCPEYLAYYLNGIKNTVWEVFSRHTKRIFKIGSVTVFPSDKELWLESLRTCRGVLMGAGFEGPSEVLHLGKKLIVVPMSGQYEQLCNSVALDSMGIKSLKTLNSSTKEAVQSWVNSTKAVKVSYPDNKTSVALKILNNESIIEINSSRVSSCSLNKVQELIVN